MAVKLRHFRGADDALPSVAAAGVQLDNCSNSGYEAALSTYNWNHTVAGSNRFLIVAVGVFAAGTVSSITYGAQSLSKITGSPYTDGTYSVELWYLVAPTVGTAAVTVTLSASLTSISAACSYTGVDQTTPWEGNTGMSHAPLDGIPVPLLNITTTVDQDWRFDAMSNSSASITAGTGFTTENSNTGALGGLYLQDQGPVSPGTVSAAWGGLADTQHFAIAGIGIRPVPAGGVAVAEDDAYRPPIVSDTDRTVMVWR